MENDLRSRRGALAPTRLGAGRTDPAGRGSSTLTPELRAEIQALVIRLADGDRSAIVPAVEALRPLVRRFCARVLGNVADAEDTTQHTLLKLFDQVADFDARRDAVAWALTIASFECRTLRRKAERRREDGRDVERLDLAAAHETAEEALVRRDLEAAVRDVLGTLRAEDIETILQAIMGDPGRRPRSPAFRKRLQRAIERLRVAWRAKHGSE
jgi:RNA polymerase sigma factor (sigma-70 family)